MLEVDHHHQHIFYIMVSFSAAIHGFFFYKSCYIPFCFPRPLKCFPCENILAISENPEDKSSISVLKKLTGCAIIFHAAGMWLSLVERCVRDAKAAGSNPVIPTIDNESRVYTLLLLSYLH